LALYEPGHFQTELLRKNGKFQKAGTCFRAQFSGGAVSGFGQQASGQSQEYLSADQGAQVKAGMHDLSCASFV